MSMARENQFNIDWIQKTYANKKVKVISVEEEHASHIKHVGMYSLDDLIKELSSDVANFTTDKSSNSRGHEEVNKWMEHDSFSISYIEFEYVEIKDYVKMFEEDIADDSLKDWEVVERARKYIAEMQKIIEEV